MSPSAPAGQPRRLPRGMARYATVVCVLAVAAAVVSFVKGSWLGIVWVLVAGLSSNMAWYYVRRARLARTAPGDGPGAASGTGAAGSADDARAPSAEASVTGPPATGAE